MVEKHDEDQPKVIKGNDRPTNLDPLDVVPDEGNDEAEEESE